eukprot:scaffold1525_cov142-Cylindrotheca_fusiformis.AAC.203
MVDISSGNQQGKAVYAEPLVPIYLSGGRGDGQNLGARRSNARFQTFEIFVFPRYCGIYLVHFGEGFLPAVLVHVMARIGRVDEFAHPVRLFHANELTI